MSSPIEIKGAGRDALRPLFVGQTDTLINSYLDGCMGNAWADSAHTPRCAQIILAGFCFFGGDASAPGAALLAGHNPNCAELLIIPHGTAWASLVESAHPNSEKTTRYAFKKGPVAFDVNHLTNLAASLPSGFSLLPIDGTLYHTALAHPFSQDFCGNFASEQDFAARGLGFCVMHKDELVAGTSSYSVYNGGIEIEVATRHDFRSLGLATACSARLILECLDRGLYPSWDAANLISVKLAQKLGYQFSHEYTTYCVK